MQINFGSSAKKSKASERSTISKITKKIEQLLPADGNDDMQIMVTEIQCFDPDCVPIETLVIILGNSARWTQKILKPMADVTDSDILELKIPKSWVAFELQKQQSARSVPNEIDDDEYEGDDVVRLMQERESTTGWVESIVEEIELRSNTVNREECLQELTRISAAIQRIQRKLNSQEEHYDSDVTAVPMTPVTHVPMRSNGQALPSSVSNATSISSNDRKSAAMATATTKAATRPAHPTPLPSAPQPVFPPSKKVEKMKVIVSAEDEMQTVRHKKGVRQRGEQAVYITQ
jgi:hypothetical protein